MGENAQLIQRTVRENVSPFTDLLHHQVKSTILMEFLSVKNEYGFPQDLWKSLWNTRIHSPVNFANNEFNNGLLKYWAEGIIHIFHMEPALIESTHLDRSPCLHGHA